MRRSMRRILAATDSGWVNSMATSTGVEKSNEKGPVLACPLSHVPLAGNCFNGFTHFSAQPLTEFSCPKVKVRVIPEARPNIGFCCTPGRRLIFGWGSDQIPSGVRPRARLPLKDVRRTIRDEKVIPFTTMGVNRGAQLTLCILIGRYKIRIGREAKQFALILHITIVVRYHHVGQGMQCHHIPGEVSSTCGCRFGPTRNHGGKQQCLPRLKPFGMGRCRINLAALAYKDSVSDSAGTVSLMTSTVWPEAGRRISEWHIRSVV